MFNGEVYKRREEVPNYTDFPMWEFVYWFQEKPQQSVIYFDDPLNDRFTLKSALGDIWWWCASE
jgi:hypothetical protein